VVNLLWPEVVILLRPKVVSLFRPKVVNFSGFSTLSLECRFVFDIYVLRISNRCKFNKSTVEDYYFKENLKNNTKKITNFVAINHD